MKATELRIGNWFIDYEAEPEVTIYWQVEQIVKPTYGTNLGVTYRDGSSWTSLDILEPIPLTKEWLLKFGFRYITGWDDYEAFIKDDVEITYNEIVKFKNYIDVELKYVHQLQNLYFALTDNELTIK